MSKEEDDDVVAAATRDAYKNVSLPYVEHKDERSRTILALFTAFIAFFIIVVPLVYLIFYFEIQSHMLPYTPWLLISKGLIVATTTAIGHAMLNLAAKLLVPLYLEIREKELNIKK